MMIYKALAAVQAEVGKRGIGKERRNTAQSFNFRGVDDVMNTLNPILSAHSVVVLPEFSDRTVTQMATKSGGVMVNVAVRGTFTFVAEDGSSLKAATYGEASDTGDKATNKAMAAAYKYAMFQALCIPTEGDDDTDADAAQPEPVRSAEVKAQTKAVAKPAKPAKTLETFGFVEDAMDALTLVTDQESLNEWSARVKASIVSQNWSEADSARLRAGKTAKAKELGL